MKLGVYLFIEIMDLKYVKILMCIDEEYELDILFNF